MPQFVRHHISENIRQSNVPVGVQLHRLVKEDIAIAACAVGGQEGYTKHFARRTPMHNSYRKVGGPFDGGTVQVFQTGPCSGGRPHPPPPPQPPPVPSSPPLSPSPLPPP